MEVNIIKCQNKWYIQDTDSFSLYVKDAVLPIGHFATENMDIALSFNSKSDTLDFCKKNNLLLTNDREVLIENYCQENNIDFGYDTVNFGYVLGVEIGNEILEVSSVELNNGKGIFKDDDGNYYFAKYPRLQDLTLLQLQHMLSYEDSSTIDYYDVCKTFGKFKLIE